MKGLLTRWAVCVAVGGSALLAAPTSSLADGSLTLSVGSDQVAGLPVSYTATGTIPAYDVGAINPATLNVLVRPANLGSCGSDWILDPSETNGNDGESLIGGQTTQITGGQSFSFSSTIPGISQGRRIDTLMAPLGPYLVCGWIDDDQSMAPAASAASSFTLRAPRFTMKLSAPRQPRLHHKGTFVVRGTSEIPAHVTLEVLPACFVLRNSPAGVRCAGRPLRNCAATPEAESNYIEDHNDVGIEAVTLISREISRGAFSIQQPVAFGHGWIPARHMVCAWISTTSSEGIADSQTYLTESAAVTPSP